MAKTSRPPFGHLWLAILLFGAAGFIVDRVTGAMYEHNPNVIKVTLEPEQ